MRTIIVGAGQIGNSLDNVLSDYYYTAVIDKGEKAEGKFEIMHICFPYSDKFIDYVKSYQKEYQPKYTVIHSTVPVGTSRKCNAIHSPVRGIHPNLESGIKTFVKFLGGEGASEVADYFRRAGLTVYLTDKQETTELMKIWSTTWYGMDIEKTKQIKRDCIKNDVPFEFWTIWTNTYNMGYNKLGHPEYSRPNLVPIMKVQGGHCTVSNAEFMDNVFSDIIKKNNSKGLSSYEDQYFNPS